MHELVKYSLTAAAILLIALIAGLITTRYHRRQLQLSRDNFLELFVKIPRTEPEKRANAILVAIPILRVDLDLAFKLAVDYLAHDVGAMEALHARYPRDFYAQLERHLGRGPVYRTAEFVPDVEYAARLLDDLSNDVQRWPVTNILDVELAITILSAAGWLVAKRK